MATHSSIFAWKISWTEELGGLQSIGSQRVRHDWATKTLYIHKADALCCTVETNKTLKSNNTLMCCSRVHPGGSDGKSICLQCGRPGFNPWVGKIPWRRKWHPTPVFLPGESHGRRSLVGYSPWGCKQPDATERLHFHFTYSNIS